MNREFGTRLSGLELITNRVTFVAQAFPLEVTLSGVGEFILLLFSDVSCFHFFVCGILGLRKCVQDVKKEVAFGQFVGHGIVYE